MTKWNHIDLCNSGVTWCFNWGILGVSMGYPWFFDVLLDKFDDKFFDKFLTNFLTNFFDEFF